MTIKSHNSYLDVSVSHGIFHMAAQVKLTDLLLGYLFFGILAIIKFKLMRKFSKK